jgi:hypothetical protein
MIESEDDRLLFFDPADFGEEVTLQIDGQGPVVIRAIFDTRPPFTATNFKGFRGTDDMGHDLGQVSGTQPRLTALSAAVVGVKAGRATFTVRGKAYMAHKVTADGTGITLIDLKLA